MGVSTPLTFREATPADTHILLPLIRKAYRGTEGWTTEAAYLDDERISEEGLLKKINSPNGTVLIATHADTGDLISCCEIEAKASREDGVKMGYFGLFAVQPQFQGSGVGARVLAKAESYAQENWGVEKMEMQVIWLRDELISYYIRKGYSKSDETRPFPYAEVVNGKALRDDLYFVVLVKELPRPSS